MDEEVKLTMQNVLTMVQNNTYICAILLHCLRVTGLYNLISEVESVRKYSTQVKVPLHQ